MSDDLLTDIVAAERDIRSRNTALERELADRLEALRSELAAELQQEVDSMEESLARALDHAIQTARREAVSLLAEANAYAERMNDLVAGDLDQVVVRHLLHLHPEGTHDRQDEQA
jgi:vacuolar-type H+-ATPase subunit H